MKNLLKRFINWRGFFPFGLGYGFGAGLIAAAVPMGWFKVIVILFAMALVGLWAVADYHSWNR